MIRKAQNKDKEQIVNIFCSNIDKQRSYISHGEIQMGIATDSENLSNDYIEKWSRYLDAQMDKFSETVFVYEQDGTVEGFIIGEIDSDRDEKFGVICDLVVKPDIRNKGVGSRLLDFLLNRFSELKVNDFYLESGVNNHEAHEFFKKKGFEKVSSIFRLNNK